MAARGGAGAPLPRRNVPPNPFAFLRLEPVGYFSLQVLLLSPLPPPHPGKKKKQQHRPKSSFPPLFFSVRIRNNLIFPVQPLEAEGGGRDGTVGYGDVHVSWLGDKYRSG